MSEMKSGVYFVKYKDIKTFFLEVEKNGWKHVFTNPQAQAYNSLREELGKDNCLYIVIKISLILQLPLDK